MVREPGQCRAWIRSRNSYVSARHGKYSKVVLDVLGVLEVVDPEEISAYTAHLLYLDPFFVW